MSSINIPNSISQQWSNERFGMSTDGRAFACAPVMPVRERLLAAVDAEVKGHVGSAPLTGDATYIPGTNAWSPPPC